MSTSFTRSWVDERLGWVLQHCRHAVDGMELNFYGQASNFMRLAESSITQASNIRSGKVSVRVLVGNREARGSTTDLSDAGLRACVARAVLHAKELVPASERLALAIPEELSSPSTGAVHSPTVALSSADKRDWLAAPLAAHGGDGVALAGRFHTGESVWAVQSTEGVAKYHRASWADVALSALERPAGHGASSCRPFFGAQVSQEELHALSEEVRLECRRASNPRSLVPGHWDVVLSPLAVADLLEWLGAIGFGSQSFDDGTSFLHGRLGTRVTGEAISIFDDASMPHGVGVPRAFDAEGMDKTHVALVTSGVARGVVHDSQTARRYGVKSTGHADLNDDFPAAGSLSAHLHIAPGTGSLEAMIQGVKRGIFVTRLHYVNGMIEPRRAVMTGLLRDAAFLIEDGELKHAVTPMRFTDSILEAFDRVPGAAGISRDLAAHSSFYGPQRCTVTPSMMIPKLRFTSGRK